MQIIINKLERLKQHLSAFGQVAVAYSSGVDSTFLLKIAHDILGDNAIAITAAANFFPQRELNEAKDFCKRENIRQLIFNVNATEIAGFRENPVNRCYLCKRMLFNKIKELAAANNIVHIIEGSNLDDNNDYRPGLKALEELGIKSPLKETGLYKKEIRELSRELKLPTWDKPSFACLASRFVYGETISDDKLSMVERAEQLLMDRGFKQFRVRVHGQLARIELLPEEFPKIMEENLRKEINKKFRTYGFNYVSLDLQGYKTGNMNVGLK